VPAVISFSTTTAGGGEKVVGTDALTGLTNASIIRIPWADLNTVPSSYLQLLRTAIVAHPGVTFNVSGDFPQRTLEYLTLSESVDGPDLPAGSYTMVRPAADASWVTGTLVLGDGEIGLNTTNGQMKRGDGVTTWANLKDWPLARQHAVTTVPGTTYTPLLSDAGKTIEFTSATAVALTAPTDASVAFPISTQIFLRQVGAGAVTTSAPGGTINAKGGTLAMTQWAYARLTKRAANTWVFDLLA